VTKRVCVLGYPVGHSRSPSMHNAAFAELGLDWTYEALEVKPDGFAELVRELPDRGFVGANVTVPHKLSALAVADSVTETARTVGAANTLTFVEGRISAHNTDVEGFLRALQEKDAGAPAGMRALVLGAGGAARAVVYGLLTAGAGRVEVWNRHRERAEALVDDLREHASGIALSVIPEPGLSEIDLLVNATSVGMEGRNGSGEANEDFKLLRISADKLADVQVVVDLVYRNGGTELLREAKGRGLICVDGIDILVHQGAASFELWTGRQPPLGVMRLGARTPQSGRDT
jgi:shikimate dehydrogenase